MNNVILKEFSESKPVEISMKHNSFLAVDDVDSKRSRIPIIDNHYHITKEEINSWPEDFFTLYGSAALETLERGPQGDFEVREAFD